MVQTEIDPDLVLGWDPWFIVLFDEEGDEERARPGHRHRRRPDDALERTMLFELHEADFRKSHLAVLDADRTVLVVRRVGRSAFASSPFFASSTAFTPNRSHSPSNFTASLTGDSSSTINTFVMMSPLHPLLGNAS